MGVPMVQVGIVGMLVAHWLVAVPVGMWFGNFTFMGVVVVSIMHMAVLVLQFCMDVLMFVAFGQMKPETNRHQDARDYELRRHRLL